MLQRIWSNTVISYTLEHAPEEMEFFNKFVDKGLLDRLHHIVNSDFERVTYTEAVEILKKADKDFQFPVEWGIDLQTEHERYLTEEVFKKPIFVIDYPKEIKAFYMRLNDDGKTVAACDLLVPGVGEIIGGSQREERLDILEARMDEIGMNRELYDWYVDLRRYGGVKHAGYGLGFERMIMYLTGIVTSVTLFHSQEHLRTLNSKAFKRQYTYTNNLAAITWLFTRRRWLRFLLSIKILY